MRRPTQADPRSSHFDLSCLLRTAGQPDEPSEKHPTMKASTDPRETPVFDARNITKIYDMGEVQVHALRGVDVQLAESEFVVLLGPSGSGKSTLLNILGGLDTPTSGKVFYRGASSPRPPNGSSPAIAVTTLDSYSSSTT